jgi:hypothetical protein
MNVSVLISYCSVDNKIIRALIKQLLIFTDDILVARYDKLFNGKHEKLDDLEDVRDANPEKIKVLYLPFIAGKPTRYYHNSLRWEGIKYTKYDSLIFLDSDEILDGNIVKLMLENGIFSNIQAASFASYWYFRSAKFQSLQTEDLGLFIQKKLVTEKLMFTELERRGVENTQHIKFIRALALKTGPFSHHYSWVRTKEEMISKVTCWGHKNDKNWVPLVEEEFSRDFNGTDFVHGYSYRIVPDYFKIGI